MGHGSIAGFGFILPNIGPPAFPGQSARSCGDVSLCPLPTPALLRLEGGGYPGGKGPPALTHPALSPQAMSPVTAPFTYVARCAESGVFTHLPELPVSQGLLRVSTGTRLLPREDRGREVLQKEGDPAVTGSVPKCPHDELMAPDACIESGACREESEDAAWSKVSTVFVSSSIEGGS